MEELHRANPFDALRARSLVFWGIVSIPAIFLAEIGIRALTNLPSSDEAVSSIAIFAGLYSLILLWILGQSKRHGIRIRRVIGNRPRGCGWLLQVGSVVPVLVFSAGAFWLLYYALSFVLPSFVETALNQKIFLSASETRIPLHYNIFATMFFVIIGPFCEELLFRGILFQRWATKWGVRGGLFASSITFGALHFDFIGAIVFGYVAGILYLKTRTLTVPVIFHILNNAIVLALFAILLSLGQTDVTTLDQFRADVWIGIFLFLLGLPWVIHFLYKNRSVPNFQIPYLAGAATSQSLTSPRT